MDNNYKKILNIVTKSLVQGDLIPLNSFLFNGKTNKSLYFDISKRIQNITKYSKIKIYQDTVYFKIPENCFNIDTLYLNGVGQIELSEIKLSSFGDNFREFISNDITEYLSLKDFENENIAITFKILDLNGLDELSDYYLEGGN